MKIKKFISAATCAALITAAALPLTACGGAKSFKKAKDFDLSNYAQELPEEAGAMSKSAVTKVTDLETGVSDYEIENGFVVTLKEVNDDSVVTVFNANTGKKIINNVVGEVEDITSDGVLIESELDDDFVFTLYGEDGTKLVENSYDYNIRVNHGAYWIGDNTKQSRVLTVTGEDKNGDDFSNYFEVEYDLFGNITSYKTINKSDIHYVAPEFSTGSDKFALAQLIYSDSAKPVTGDIASYKYATIGNEIVFSNNGTETGRVSTDNLMTKAFVGNYMYYTVRTELPEGSKDANLIWPGTNKEFRYSYQLHKYDILKNKDSKLNYSYYINELLPVYNYEAKAFDAVVIAGRKIINKTVQTNSDFVYVANAELAVAYDITSVADAVGEFSDVIYKLDEGKFLLNPESPVIVNDKFELISTFNGAAIQGFYANEKLLAFRAGEGMGLVDYNGKIVVAPEYAFMFFYDGKALASKISTNEFVVLSADGSETKLPESSSKDGTTVVVTPGMFGWYTVSTLTVPEEGDPTSKIEIFNYSGTSLKTYTNQEVEFESEYNILVVEHTDSEGGAPTYTLSIIE